MDKREPKNLLPEEEYLKQMSALPKVKAPGDFLQKVHERIERRSAFGKIMRALFVPVKIKVPLELAAMAATIILIVSTIGIKKPAELSLLVRTQEPALAGAMRKSAVSDSMKIMELEEKAEKEETRHDKMNMSAEQMPYADETLSKVKNQIESVRGKVTNVEVNKDTGMPQYVDAEIPAAGYAKFVEKLSGIGVLQEPILKEAPQGQGIIQVRIKLLAK